MHYGYEWLSMAIYDYIWVCSMTMYSYVVRLCMAMDGYL